MKTITMVRPALVTTALALTAWPAKRGWAQAVLERQASSPTSESGAPFGGMTTIAVVASVIAVLVILGALVKMMDLRRRRETEAVVIQARISDALLRDPRLYSLPVTPTAHVPFWKGSPVTVEVAGQVPSEDLCDAALSLIEREASQVRDDVHVESRLGVVPTMARRSA